MWVSLLEAGMELDPLPGRVMVRVTVVSMEEVTLLVKVAWLVVLA